MDPQGMDHVRALRLMEALAAHGFTVDDLETLARNPMDHPKGPQVIRAMRGFSLGKGAQDTRPEELVMQALVRLGHRDEQIEVRHVRKCNHNTESRVLMVSRSKQDATIEGVLLWLSDTMRMLGVHCSVRSITRPRSAHFRVVNLARSDWHAVRARWCLVNHRGPTHEEGEMLKSWPAGLEYLLALAQHPDRIYDLFRRQHHGGRLQNILLRGLEMGVEPSEHDEPEEGGLVWGPVLITPSMRPHLAGSGYDLGLHFTPLRDEEIHGIPHIEPYAIG